jgi:DNA invertase Pin-like site-specific DNA recombinase
MPEFKDTLYIYTRVSSEKQTKGHSLEAQQIEGIKKAKSLGFYHIVLTESGRSAKYDDLNNRPELSRLMNMCVSGEVKHIFVTEWDRLSRNEMISAYLKKVFKEESVTIYTVRETLDLSDYNSNFIASILSAASVLENATRVERIKRTKLESVRSGKSRGGMQAYGYKTDENKKTVIDEEEKEIYLKIVEWSLNGMGTPTIARKLNDLGIPTKASKTYKKGIHLKDKFTNEEKFIPKEDIRWAANTVLSILKNPIYKGEMRYQDQSIPVPKIIDKDTWDAIQSNLESNRINSKRNLHTDQYLVGGFLKCKRCGAGLYGIINQKKGMRIYRCLSKRNHKSCGIKNVNLDKMNDRIWLILMYVLKNWEELKQRYEQHLSSNIFSEDQVKRRVKSINRKIKKKDEELDRAISLYTKGRIDLDKYDEIKNKIESEKSVLFENLIIEEKKLQIRSDQNDVLEYLQRFSNGILSVARNASNSEKRSVIEKLIEKIEIDYIEDIQDHEILIKLKFPLFEGNQNESLYSIDVKKPKSLDPKLTPFYNTAASLTV